MKMDPIVFRTKVKSGEGFTPYRNDKGEWISQRDILLIAKHWNLGSYIQFKIVESFSDINGCVQPYQRECCHRVFYDKDNKEVAELMDNLASGDLRGRVAESTAHKLYWKLFVRSEEMQLFLPELIDYFDKVGI